MKIFVKSLLVVVFAVFPALSQTVECTGVLTGVIDANVVVPSGSFCELFAATVTGNVRVESGALAFGASLSTLQQNLHVISSGTSIDVVDTTVEGDVTVIGQQEEEVLNPTNFCGRIGGNLLISGTDSLVRLGTVRECTDLFVGGGVRLENNTGSLRVARVVTAGDVSIGGNSGATLTLSLNEVGGSLHFIANSALVMSVTRTDIADHMKVIANTGLVDMDLNTIGKYLICQANDPPPLSVGNVAEGTQGQCEAVPPTLE